MFYDFADNHINAKSEKDESTMSTKKVSTNKPVPAAADAMKRLTIDVPESLHRSIKAQCAMRGTKIADEVRELLLQKYGQS